MRRLVLRGRARITAAAELPQDAGLPAALLSLMPPPPLGPESPLLPKGAVSASVGRTRVRIVKQINHDNRQSYIALRNASPGPLPRQRPERTSVDASLGRRITTHLNRVTGRSWREFPRAARRCGCRPRSPGCRPRRWRRSYRGARCPVPARFCALATYPPHEYGLVIVLPTIQIVSGCRP